MSESVTDLRLCKRWTLQFIVMPANAGIQYPNNSLDSGFRRNDD
jgi:hypothetical protein